jgi:hypothetical protein
MADAITAAHEAFPAWAATPPAEKAALLLKAAEIIKRRTDEIADMLARETGSTLLFSQFQQGLVADTLKQAAGWVYLPKGEVLQSNVPGTHSVDAAAGFDAERRRSPAPSFRPTSSPAFDVSRVSRVPRRARSRSRRDLRVGRSRGSSAL